MHFITAIAAFAATMFMLSVIVSVMTEMVHRFWRLRAKGLRQMIERLYDHSIKPRMLAVDANGKELLASQFASLMMENRAAGGIEAANGAVQPGAPTRLDELEDISAEVFTQKLADLKLKPRDANANADEIIKDISAKFVAFGAEMTVAFARRARTISVVCALVLAVIAYVHPYNIATVYLTNRELAQKIANVGATLEEDLKKVDALGNDLSQAAESGEGVQAKADELEKAVEQLDAKLGILKAQGVPIGWPATDSACTGLSLISNCSIKAGAGHFTFPSVLNFVWLLFGGLLVGLGAPFWRQIIAAATTSNELTRKLSNIVGGVEATAPAGGGGAPAGGAPDPTSLNTFKVATDAGPVQPRVPPKPAG